MDWSFDLPRKKMVLTSRHVQEVAPILYGSRDDEDDRWEFHPREIRGGGGGREACELEEAL